MTLTEVQSTRIGESRAMLAGRKGQNKRADS